MTDLDIFEQNSPIFEQNSPIFEQNSPIFEQNSPKEAVNHVLRNTSAALEGMCREDTDQAIEDAVLKMSWAILMMRRIQRRKNAT